MRKTNWNPETIVDGEDDANLRVKARNNFNFLQLAFNAIQTAVENAIEEIRALIPKPQKKYVFNVLDYVPNGYIPGVTDASGAINSAMSACSDSGGGDVFAPPGTFYIGSANLSVPSNVRVIGGGRGKTIFVGDDVGSAGSPSYFINFGISVSNASIADLTLSCATRTATTYGIRAQGKNLEISSVECRNLYAGILGEKTSQYVDVYDYLQTATNGFGGFSILLNGVKDWILDDIDLQGQSTSIGFDRGLAFQNGQTVYGCQRIKVSNYRANYTQAPGLGGYPDDYYNGTFPGSTWTIFFQAATGVQPSDIGKTVKQGATTLGILLDYDDTVLPSRWVIQKTGTISANTATTITSGTAVTATTLINNFQQKAPCITGGEWDNVDCNHGLSNLIGHGISLDSCYETHLSNFSCKFNSHSGIYVGDNIGLGTTIKGGTSAWNVYGIVCAASALNSIESVDIHENSSSGIYFIPISSGLDQIVNSTNITKCLIYRNARNHSTSDDGGISGKPSRCVFEGDIIVENYFHGVSLTDASDNQFRGNIIEDNGWTGGPAPTGRDGIRMEGTCLRNLVESNYIGNRLTAVQDYGVHILVNANDNVIRNNFLIGNVSGPILDGGLRNQDFDNLKTTDASTLANGSGLTVRANQAAVKDFSASVSGAPALTATSTTTGNTIPTIKSSNSADAGAAYSKALHLDNINSDFSGDLFYAASSGSGTINSVNGAFLGFVDASAYILRVLKSYMFLGIDLKLGTAGNGIYVKEGSNATMGTAVLVLGVATINTTKVTANSRIFLTPQVLGTIASPVALAVTARTAGTSFTITSANLTDTSTVAWIIMEPA